MKDSTDSRHWSYNDYTNEDPPPPKGPDVDLDATDTTRRDMEDDPYGWERGKGDSNNDKPER